MRVKLTVSHADRGGEARTYVLEQDPITIGRGGTCDLPLDDPDRVVSKEHAQIRREGDALRVFDLGSKNQTFVNGHRVGTAGLAVADGDRIQLGPFLVDVAVDRARLVADDLDRTVFGAAFNPFQETAEGLAAALGQLRRAFAETDYSHRAEALTDALRGALGPGPDADTLSGLVAGLSPAPAADASSAVPAGPLATAASGAVPAPPAASAFAPPDPFARPAPLPANNPFAPAPRTDPFATPADDPFAPPPMPRSGAMPATVPPPPAASVTPSPVLAPTLAPVPVNDDVLRVLAAAAARLVSLPGQFRHEFLGHTVIQSPETAFLFDADVDALVAHMAHPEPGERTDRQQRFRDAAEAVLHHHQGLLEGYRAAVRDGAAMLIDALDPDRLDDGGGLLPGARERALLERLRQRCAEMRSDSFAATERRIYRPAFIQAYLDSVARAEAPSPAPPSDP